MCQSLNSVPALLRGQNEVLILLSFAGLTNEEKVTAILIVNVHDAVPLEKVCKVPSLGGASRPERPWKHVMFPRLILKLEGARY